MYYWQIIILGLIEGITEFLPISSTAHLMLASSLINLEGNFISSLIIAIQLGAILAVIVLYGKKLLSNKKIWLLTTLTFLPTALIGFLLYSIIKNYFLENLLIAGWALILGGIIILLIDKKPITEDTKPNWQEITPKKALLVGFFQSLAIIPGVSRAAATIISGLGLKISRTTIAEFSFIVAVPVIMAAAGYDLYKNAFSFNIEQIYDLIISGFVSFIFAIVAIKTLINYLKKHNFFIFGIYRIIIGLIIIFWYFLSK